MTNINWRDLVPHVPLGPGDALYVERAGSAGEEIAEWILAGPSPLLVGGPAGIGKSTELARAAALLQADRVACLVQLDRFENMRRLDPDRMRLRIIQRIGYLAQHVLHLGLSASLNAAVDKVNATLQGEAVTHDTSPTTLLDATLAEVGRISKQGRVTLLIDGLEKVPPGPVSLDLFDALAATRADAELVVVIPWHAAFGPQAETVIRAGERFVAVRAIDVDGATGEPGRAFLRRVLAQRLQWNEEELDPSAVRDTAEASVDEARARVAAQRNLVDDAIRWSGGIPRTFLQLMAGAGLYGARRTAEPWPRDEDMADARADQVESVGRLFMPGDEAAIRAVVGTTGRELDLERKVRLMAHGILLERVRDGAPILELHPLAEAALATGGGQRA